MFKLGADGYVMWMDRQVTLLILTFFHPLVLLFCGPLGKRRPFPQSLQQVSFLLVGVTEIGIFVLFVYFRLVQNLLRSREQPRTSEPPTIPFACWIEAYATKPGSQVLGSKPQACGASTLLTKLLPRPLGFSNLKQFPDPETRCS